MRTIPPGKRIRRKAIKAPLPPLDEEPAPTEEYEVHPVADLYPMMDEDALNDMAEDIRINGQIEPIVYDQYGRLIDGRNRKAACAIAGVIPDAETRTFANEAAIVAHILSRNNERRDLTKGQKAMIRVFANPDAWDRSDTDRSEETSLDASSKRIRQQAWYVYARSKPYAEQVRVGELGLDKALELVRGAEKQGEERKKRLAAIKRKAPLIAADVEEGSLVLEVAEAKLAERDKHIQETRDFGLQAGRSLQDMFKSRVAAIFAAVALAREGDIPRDEVRSIISREAIEQIEDDIATLKLCYDELHSEPEEQPDDE